MVVPVCIHSRCRRDLCMKSWTVERKTTFCLIAIFILLAVLNLASASMTFRSSRSITLAMLDMTLFMSIAAFIVVRRITRLLLNAKTAADLDAEQLKFQLSERKRSEAKLESTNKRLEASEAGYRNLVDSSQIAILVERGQAIVLANKAAAKLLGVPSTGDLIGRRLTDFVGPEDRGRTQRVLWRLAEREL